MESSLRNTAAPLTGSVERWCFDLITTSNLAEKLAPPAVPATDVAEAAPDSPPLRIDAPGRPAALTLQARSPRTPKAGALRDPKVRAQLFHTFLHHELQAAELFAWAVLAFPETPRAFRNGLVALAVSELEHLALYRSHLGTLGASVGDFPVRDWFWERVAKTPDALGFVALQGLGLEGANLEHSARFAKWFRAAGDEAGARVLDQVEEEEIAHVAFARRWFERLSGQPFDYDRWCAALPTPLTPALLRGKPLNLDARRRAGFDEAYLERLQAEPPAEVRRGS